MHGKCMGASKISNWGSTGIELGTTFAHLHARFKILKKPFFSVLFILKTTKILTVSNGKK